MTLAQEAYLVWKSQHKVNMQVHTDEQMFCLGFDSRNDEVKELSELIVDMMERIKKQDTELKKLKKVKRESV